MRKLLGGLIALMQMLLLTGCPEAKYQDESSAVQYSGLAGSRYQSKVDLVLHSVSYGRGPSKTIDEYVITPKPGFDGPEVVNRAMLKMGTIVRIGRVLVCTNCITAKVKFEVNLHPPQTDPSVLISLIGVDVTRLQDGRKSLTTELFLNQETPRDRPR